MGEVAPQRRLCITGGLALGCLVGMAVLGCRWISPERPEASVGDLYWNPRPESEPGEQLVERWTLTWNQEGHPETKEETWRVARGSILSLVMTGSVPNVPAGKAAAEQILQVFERTALDLQNQGAIVRGLHLALRGPGRGSPSESQRHDLAELYQEIRRGLGGELELSATIATLDPTLLDLELAELGPHLDWALIDVYGQDFGAPDEPLLWDLEAGLNRLRLVRASGVKSRALLHLEGSVDLLAGQEATPITNRLPCSLLSELTSRAESVFKFEGFFRQVFQASTRDDILQMGDTQIATGTRLRVTRITPGHLRKLRDSIRELGDESFLGYVYRGVSQDPENCLGIDRAALAATEGVVDRNPTLVLEPMSGNEFQLTLRGGSEPTALGKKRYNYVDLMAGETSLVGQVQLGEFARYVFLSPKGEPLPGFTGKGVRFFFPLLGPDQAVTATVRIKGDHELKAQAVFRSSIGGELLIEPAVWPQPGAP